MARARVQASCPLQVEEGRHADGRDDEGGNSTRGPEVWERGELVELCLQ